MSLSLEVKKFVNSESIGDFVTILLPGELPTDNAEIRAMNRERAAAQRAAQEALALLEDEKLAKSGADEAKKALDEAKKALAEQDKAFEAQKKEHDKLKSEHGKKKEALDKAKKTLDELTAEAAKLSAALSTAKDTLSASEKAKTEAESALSELKKAAESKEDAPANGEQAKKAEGEEKPEQPEKTAETAEAAAEAEDTEKPQEDKPSEAAAQASEKTGEQSSEDGGEKPATDEKPAEEAENTEKSEDAEASEKAAGGDEKPDEADPEKKVEAEVKPSPTLEESEKALEEANSALDKARSELEKAEKAHKSADESAKKKQKEHEKLAAEFAQFNTLFESAAASFELFKEERNAVVEQVKALEEVESEASVKLSEVKKAHESAEKEAARLKGAVRTLKTEHESASMHYLESGKGETLLLIHTAGQSLFTFRSVFYKLAMNYHVVAVDLMGHGCSDRPDYFDYSAASHAESLLSFMDALGIERAHLMGFSMGAGFALELARRYPERVMSVIALSPGGVTSAMPLPIRMMESALFGGIASRLFRVKTVEKLLDECLFDHTVIGPHEVNEYYKCASDGEGRRAIRLTVSTYGEKELLESLSEVKTPVLVVSSDKDRWHPLELGEAYVNALHGCDYVVMRNAGHLMHEEKPDRTVEIVRSFIPAGYGDYDGRGEY